MAFLWLIKAFARRPRKRFFFYGVYTRAFIAVYKEFFNKRMYLVSRGTNVTSARGDFIIYSPQAIFYLTKIDARLMRYFDMKVYNAALL